MAIDDPYLAYCFDEAVGDFGSFITGELDNVEGKNAKQIEGRRTTLLRRLLSADPKERFAAPPVTRTKEA